jgi:hypothetical protein
MREELLPLATRSSPHTPVERAGARGLRLKKQSKKIKAGLADRRFAAIRAHGDGSQPANWLFRLTASVACE